MAANHESSSAASSSSSSSLPALNNNQGVKLTPFAAATNSSPTPSFESGITPTNENPPNCPSFETEERVTSPGVTSPRVTPPSPRVTPPSPGIIAPAIVTASDTVTVMATGSRLASLSFAELVKEDLSTLEEVTRESNSNLASFDEDEMPIDEAREAVDDDSINSPVTINSGDHETIGGRSTNQRSSPKPSPKKILPGQNQITHLSSNLPIGNSPGQITSSPEAELEQGEEVQVMNVPTGEIINNWKYKLVMIAVIVIAIISKSPTLTLHFASFAFGLLIGAILILPATVFVTYKYLIQWPDDEDENQDGDQNQDTKNNSNLDNLSIPHSPSLSPELMVNLRCQNKNSYSNWVLIRTIDADSLLGSNQMSKNRNSSSSNSATTTNCNSMANSPSVTQNLNNGQSIKAPANILQVSKKCVHLRIDPPSFIRLASHKKVPSLSDDRKKIQMMSTAKPENVKIIDLNKFPNKSLFIFKRKPGTRSTDNLLAATSASHLPPKLKHIWSKRQPLIIMLHNPGTPAIGNSSGLSCGLGAAVPPTTITLVIWARDCKDKETLFWTLFPLFPIGQSYLEKVTAQKLILESKMKKSTSKDQMSSVTFNRKSSPARECSSNSILDFRNSGQSNNFGNSNFGQSSNFGNSNFGSNFGNSNFGSNFGNSNFGSNFGPSNFGSGSNEWLQVFIEHAMRDFLGHLKWRKWLHRKMDRKLNRVKLPQFMDPLKVRGVQVGSVPKLSNGTFISREPSGDVILSFDLETGFDFVTCPSSSNLDQDSSNLDSSTSSFNVSKNEPAFEMSLETKLNAKYFTQKLQLSSPTGDNNQSKIRDEDEDNSDDDFSDTEDEEDELTFESISSNDETEEDEDLLDKSELDDWKFDHEMSSNVSNSSSNLNINQSDLEMSSVATNQAASSPSGSKSLMDQWTDKLKMKSRKMLANNPRVRKYFDTVTSSKVGVTVRVNSLKGKLIVCLSAPPSDRVWVKLDHSSSPVSTPSGQRRSTSISSESNKMDNLEPIKLDLEVIVEMNRKALMIKSSLVRSMLEKRLRKKLIEILTTYDDLSMYPLLVLPSCFYSQSGSIFEDHF